MDMNDKQYRLGLVSISFRQHSPREILETMKQAGLTCIEWGSDVHAPCGDGERLREIVALQKEYGITCSSYGTYFRLGQNPVEELTDYIAAAKLLGTNIIRLWCGSKCGGDMTDEEREALLSECRKAARIAEEHDVIFCMESHHGTLTERMEDSLMLMREINSPHFRLYWQPFQWLEPDENLPIAQKVGPFAEIVHVFQWRKPKLAPTRFSLYEGVEEWRRYLRAIPAPRTLLLEFMPDDRLSTLPAEAEALRTIIGGLS
jgi:sugar phosphate isomerase/epimerase